MLLYACFYLSFSFFFFFCFCFFSLLFDIPIHSVLDAIKIIWWPYTISGLTKDTGAVAAATAVTAAATAALCWYGDGVQGGVRYPGRS